MFTTKLVLLDRSLNPSRGLIFAVVLAFLWLGAAPTALAQSKTDEEAERGSARLTKAPKLIKEAEAEYTDEAVEARVEGTVTLKLTISSQGDVTEAEVLDGLGYGLDQAAVEAARQFEFEPAEINNQPAAVSLTFKVRFSLPTLPATFSGTLVEVDSDMPIADGVVELRYVGDEIEGDLAETRETGADGTFEFEDVPPGPYQVTVEVEGYEDKQSRVTFDSDEKVDVTYKFTRAPITLSGQIREAGTRDKLAGLTVNIYDPESGDRLRQAYTDAEGEFAFRGLEPGEYRVEIQADNYETISYVETIEADEVTQVSYFIEAEYYDEYRVKTTGKREERSVNRQRINLEEVRRIPGTGGDVVRVVQNLPGVARAPFASGSIIVRGAAPEDTKIFLQGDNIPLVYHFFGGPAVINSEMIDAVDFYPGNFSAYYGRATGGVIELRTRSPKDDRFHGFTEIDLLDATAQFEGPVTEDLSVAVSARRSYIDAILPLVLPDEGPDVTVSPKYYDYQAWVTWRGWEDHKLELFVYGSNDQVALLFPEDEPQGNAEVQVTGVDFSNSFHRVQGRWEWRPADAPVENDFIVSYGVNSFGFRAAENLNFEGDFLQSQIREDLRIQADETLEIRLGADLEFGQTNYSYAFPRFTDDGDTDSEDGEGRPNFNEDGIVGERQSPLMQPAFYTEFKYEPIEQLKVIPGLRLDYYGDVAESSVSPRLNTRWEVVDRVTLKGGVGLFTQPPVPGQTEEDFGNPDLTFEKAAHYAVGTEWSILDYLEVDATLFYRDIWDLIVQTDEVGGDGQPLIYDNDGQGRAYGLELLIRHYPKDKFFGWLAYTLSRAEQYDPATDEWNAFEYDQTHILTAVAGYNLPAGFDVSARMRVVTGSPETPIVGGVLDVDTDSYRPIYGERFSERSRTFHQLDVRVDKKFVFDTWILGVYLDVINAYNAKNEEGKRYNYDYSEQAPVMGLPIIPTLGVNGRF
ncbi:MAG: TonB family protein [Myxococcota bacterium]